MADQGTSIEELKAGLDALRRARNAELDEKFDRNLPFADGLFDRWARADELGFGAGASIYDSVFVFGDVHVGANAWVGPYVILDGSAGGIRIGAWCSISAGVHIYTHDTVRYALSGGVAAKKTGAVHIGDQCYIGSQSVIVPGVTIADQCVVGANSLVKDDVPARTIVAGTPARVIGRVEGDGDDIRLCYDK